MSKQAPPLFKQPPKKRQKLGSQAPDTRSASLFRPTTRNNHHCPSPELPPPGPHCESHPSASTVRTEVSSDNSLGPHASPHNPSDIASEPASSAVARDTPGSTASWQPHPRGGSHSTPPLLFPSTSGPTTNPLPPQATDCAQAFNSTSKSSSNAVTPVEPNSQGLQPNPGSDQPSAASTAGRSVIDTVVGPSPFDPSDSIKRQLLAAVGGSLDVASLEGLVRPLFASPPGTEQADLTKLLFAAQHQAPSAQQQGSEQLPVEPHANANGHSTFSAERSRRADASAGGVAVPALKMQANAIAKPHAKPRDLDPKHATPASNNEACEQADDYAPASVAQSQQADMHRAASAHLAAMLQIPFSGLSRMELWQPPPLKLDSPPLTISSHSPITSMPAVIPPVTLSSISNLAFHHQQHLLPSAGVARPANPAALHKALQHEYQHDGAGLDLDALMKAVQVEGAPLYAAATALGQQHAGDWPTFNCTTCKAVMSIALPALLLLCCKLMQDLVQSTFAFVIQCQATLILSMHSPKQNVLLSAMPRMCLSFITKLQAWHSAAHMPLLFYAKHCLTVHSVLELCMQNPSSNAD